MRHAAPSGYKGYRGYGEEKPIKEVAAALFDSDPLLAPNTDRDRAIGESLMASGMDYTPVGHWTQGLARLGQALVGRRMTNKADRGLREGHQ